MICHWVNIGQKWNFHKFQVLEVWISKNDTEPVKDAIKILQAKTILPVNIIFFKILLCLDFSR